MVVKQMMPASTLTAHERPATAGPTIDEIVHAMRRIESHPKWDWMRGELLEECRRVMHAKSTVLCRIGMRGELAIVSVAGIPPDMAMLTEVLARSSRRRRHSFQLKERMQSGDVVIAGRGDDFVAAVFDAVGESWPEEFVAAIAERMIHGAKSHQVREESSSEPLGTLVLPPEMIVGTSAAMQQLLADMAATVSSSLDVLLSGETGTGKELFARVAHASGPSGNGPFVAVNCAAIPGELLEAELFGVERNVATGVDPRPGLFLEADGGSMFLDEIAELSPRFQAKLLRVLQEREVLPLGAKRTKRISVRIISASNRDLSALVAGGRFRADLYYRLRGLEFRVPSLRERSDDIPALALALLARATEQCGKRVHGITASALDRLRAHPWPGNVRELQSEIRRAAHLCAPDASLDDHHFASLKPPAVDLSPVTHPDEVLPSTTLSERVAAMERHEIERALLASGGNHSRAARMLGITRNGLASKLRRLRVEVPV